MFSEPFVAIAFVGPFCWTLTCVDYLGQSTLTHGFAVPGFPP